LKISNRNLFEKGIMLKLIGRFFLRILGWTWDKKKPAQKKYIIAVAPHTSWTDYVYGTLFSLAIGLRTRVMIKKEMFKFPLGIVLRAFGAIPVDRTKNKRLADQLIGEFDRRHKMVLVITPEGTRKKVKRWKKGFYHIAQKTKVYIQLAYIDFKDKHIGFGPSFFPSGDYNEDMKVLSEFFKDKTGKFPERFAVHG